jgi:hypothetical protein
VAISRKVFMPPSRAMRLIVGSLPPSMMMSRMAGVMIIVS